ncbi:MAG: CDP-glycerol glycerophosphotransferase family protein [Treponema sp.]|jgi:hypothetical protein|nr:CDP-glycerol glycerophosphotransferase family protein [Treponema sp.]
MKIVYGLFFLIIFNLPLFAYIDPGTGSMLFSLIMGVSATLYFFARSMLIKMKGMALGKNTAASLRGESPKPEKFVFYNEGVQYWNVFKPVLDAFERRGIAVLYLTSTEQDPFFKEAYQHSTGKYIGTGNKAYAALNVLEADVCLMTTPALEVYQLKRSKGVKHYAHILHDTGDTTCYRLFGLDWFDSILLTGEYQKQDIRELENIRATRHKELVVTGSTYLDVYREKIQHLQSEENHPFTVLISPSWGQGALLSAFGKKLLDPLSETGWRIIIRPHPQSKKSEAGMLQNLAEQYKATPNFEWDYAPENLPSLSKSDVMISDFSGIIFDYVFLFDKPVLYTNAFFNIEMYDACDLDHKPWRFEVVKTFGRELRESDLNRLPCLVKKAAEDEGSSLARQHAKETAWQHIGESGERVADFLLEVRERITSC